MKPLGSNLFFILFYIFVFYVFICLFTYFLFGGSLAERLGRWARFSKVPINNGPGKVLTFTFKIEVSIVYYI